MLGVNRDQVPLLPNFAMTDYAAQGRTRPINIVDLEHCDTHQSIYTCLSRASTLKGTVIFRMCNQTIVTGGLKGIRGGYLKQEFRELELLNEITRLRWEGKLDKKVGGNTRSTLLKSYLKVYGRKKCPKNVHPALRWGKPGEDDLQIDYDDDPSFVWKTPESTVKESSKATQSKGKKRKASDPEEGSHLHLDVIPPPAKKPRKTTTRTQMFRGLKWNSLTQTCAYDSILSIISNVYFHNAHHWQESMGGANTLLGEVVNS